MVSAGEAVFFEGGWAYEKISFIRFGGDGCFSSWVG